jgi:hypothetical protein
MFLPITHVVHVGWAVASSPRRQTPSERRQDSETLISADTSHAQLTHVPKPHRLTVRKQGLALHRSVHG